jgi:hypothetical protein
MMAPDQNPQATGEAAMCPPTSTTAMRTAIACAIVELEEQEERIYEPFIPPIWKFELRQYDRINAERKYLSEIARAKRHFGFKKPIRKPNRRRHKR